MPAKSKSQKRLMSMAKAYQQGKLNTKKMNKSLVNKVKDVAKSMKPEQIEDFVKTKDEKLPQTVEKLITKFEKFNNRTT